METKTQTIKSHRNQENRMNKYTHDTENMRIKREVHKDMDIK